MLSSIPVAELHLVRRRNRAAAQRNHTFQRLHRWNTDRAALIYELLDLPPNDNRVLTSLTEPSRTIDSRRWTTRQGYSSTPITGDRCQLSRNLGHPLFQASSVPANSLPSHALNVTPKQVLQQLQSFARGSAGSRSGWRVSHFLALCPFISEFTMLINMFLSNRTPPELSALMVSGTLSLFVRP